MNTLKSLFVLALALTLSVSASAQSNLVITSDGGASNITATGAALGLNIISTNQFGLRETNYWGYGTVDGTNLLASWANIITNGAQTNGVIQTVLTGLPNNTLFYYRPFAQDASNGFVNAGSSIPFRTLIGTIHSNSLFGATNIVLATVGNVGTLSVNGTPVAGGGGGVPSGSIATNLSVVGNFTPTNSLTANNSNTVEVTISGNDTTANGSIALPFKTISNAINFACSHYAVSATNPVLVLAHDGTFAENVVVLSNSYVSLHGEGHGNTRIQLNGTTGFTINNLSNQFSAGVGTLGRWNTQANNVLSNVSGCTDLTNGVLVGLLTNNILVQVLTVTNVVGPAIFLSGSVSPTSMRNYYSNGVNQVVGNYFVTNSVSAPAFGLIVSTSVTGVDVADISFIAGPGNTNPVLMEKTFSLGTAFRDCSFNNTNLNSFTIGDFWDDMFNPRIRGQNGVYHIKGGHMYNVDILVTNSGVAEADHNYGPDLLYDVNTRFALIDGGIIHTTATNGICLKAGTPGTGDSDPRVAKNLYLIGNIETNSFSVGMKGHWWLDHCYMLTVRTLQGIFDSQIIGCAMLNAGASANQQWADQQGEADTRGSVINGGYINTSTANIVLTNNTAGLFAGSDVYFIANTNGADAWCSGCWNGNVVPSPQIGQAVSTLPNFQFAGVTTSTLVTSPAQGITVFNAILDPTVSLIAQASVTNLTSGLQVWGSVIPASATLTPTNSINMPCRRGDVMQLINTGLGTISTSTATTVPNP